MPPGPCLLDTVTLSEVIKGRDASVLARVRDYLSVHSRFQFSIITRYEILRGLKAKDAPDDEIARRLRRSVGSVRAKRQKLRRAACRRC